MSMLSFRKVERKESKHIFAAFVVYCMLSHFSHDGVFVTPWTVACQAPLSVGFSRQECCSGLPCPPPGGLPHPGIEPASPALQMGSLD